MFFSSSVQPQLIFASIAGGGQNRGGAMCFGRDFC